MIYRLYRYLRLYGLEAYYAYRMLFAWQRPGLYISLKLVFPLFMLLFFVFMGRYAGVEDSLYIVVGNILLLPSINGVLGVSMTVGNERLFGTLPYLIGSPAARGPLFLGRALFHILDGMVTVLFALPLASLFFGLDLSQADPRLLLGCVLLLSATSSGLGLIMGSISLMTQEGWFITSTISMALYILCGINFPVSALPAAMQPLAYSLPMTRGIEAARLAMAGAGWSEVGRLVLMEAWVGLLYAFIGYFLFRFMEKRSLVTGKLEAV